MQGGGQNPSQNSCWCGHKSVLALIRTHGLTNWVVELGQSEPCRSAAHTWSHWWWALVCIHLLMHQGFKGHGYKHTQLYGVGFTNGAQQKFQREKIRQEDVSLTRARVCDPNGIQARLAPQWGHGRKCYWLGFCRYFRLDLDLTLPAKCFLNLDFYLLKLCYKC